MLLVMVQLTHAICKTCFTPRSACNTDDHFWRRGTHYNRTLGCTRADDRRVEVADPVAVREASTAKPQVSDLDLTIALQDGRTSTLISAVLWACR